MRKLVYIPTVIYALFMLADIISTVAVFSLPEPRTIMIKEKHPWGYPGVIGILFLYPPIFFAISFGISKVKNQAAFCLLLALLTGFLAPFCYSSLKAVSGNLDVYERIINEKEVN